jgi:hypothetical protein
MHNGITRLGSKGLDSGGRQSDPQGHSQIVVQEQISSGVAPCRPCPDCGQSRRSTGSHDLSLRTVFGHLTVKSPRLHQCDCGSHDTSTFSPLAELLPDHTTPELLFLETKWASLMSYGMTAKLLDDVLPMDDPLNAFTIRRHVWNVAERMERELGEEQSCFITGCQRDGHELPVPDGPLTVGIDGGYICGQCRGRVTNLGARPSPGRWPELVATCPNPDTTLETVRRVGHRATRTAPAAAGGPLQLTIASAGVCPCAH